MGLCKGEVHGAGIEAAASAERRAPAAPPLGTMPPCAMDASSGPWGRCEQPIKGCAVILCPDGEGENHTSGATCQAGTPGASC